MTRFIFVGLALSICLSAVAQAEPQRGSVAVAPGVLTGGLEGRVIGTVRFRQLALDVGTRAEYYGSRYQVDGIIGGRLMHRLSPRTHAYVGAHIARTLKHDDSEGLDSVPSERLSLGTETLFGSFLVGGELIVTSGMQANEGTAVGVAFVSGVAF